MLCVWCCLAVVAGWAPVGAVRSVQGAARRGRGEGQAARCRLGVCWMRQSGSCRAESCQDTANMVPLSHSYTQASHCVITGHSNFLCVSLTQISGISVTLHFTASRCCSWSHSHPCRAAPSPHPPPATASAAAAAAGALAVHAVAWLSSCMQPPPAMHNLSMGWLIQRCVDTSGWMHWVCADSNARGWDANSRRQSPVCV